MVWFIIYILGAVFAAVIGVATFLYKRNVVYLSEIIGFLLFTFASWLSVLLWSIGCLGDFIIYQKKTKDTEMPSKIYFDGEEACEQPVFASKSIEYVHKDAFVEKAEKFIYSALNDGIMGTANIEDFMRLFKKYMED